MRPKHRRPAVQAGSMADIAFLLLIFFLVTTTIETDAGIDRKLPESDNQTEIIRKQRNILEISINRSDEIYCEDKIVDLAELHKLATAFIDNGGSAVNSPEHCSYCNGARRGDSSENPKVAVIVIEHDRETSYAGYIAVQNTLSAAYLDLRDRLGLREYGVSYRSLVEEMENPYTSELRKQTLEKQLNFLKEAYPMNLSEAALE